MLIAGKKLREQAINRTRIEIEEPQLFWKFAYSDRPNSAGWRFNYHTVAREAEQRLNVLLSLEDGGYWKDKGRWMVGK